jgi:glutamate racemase
MDQRPIAFLDSGVGGVSLLNAAKRLLPHERYLMVADGSFFPYGDLTPSLVCARVERMAEFVLGLRAKLIVLACNTASVYALAHVRSRFPDVPFVGVVPVVKTLAQRTRSGTIALLSTPGTAESLYLTKLINEFASERRVISVPGRGLAELVESGETRGQRTLDLLERCLSDVLSSDADVLGLACTHYLFLRRPIKRLLGPGVRVFDPSRPVARRIRQVLSERSILAGGPLVPDAFYTTGDPSELSAVLTRLMRRRDVRVEAVDF